SRPPARAARAATSSGPVRAAFLSFSAVTTQEPTHATRLIRPTTLTQVIRPPRSLIRLPGWSLWIVTAGSPRTHSHSFQAGTGTGAAWAHTSIDESTDIRWTLLD